MNASIFAFHAEFWIIAVLSEEYVQMSSSFCLKVGCTTKVGKKLNEWTACHIFLMNSGNASQARSLSHLQCGDQYKHRAIQDGNKLISCLDQVLWGPSVVPASKALERAMILTRERILCTPADIQGLVDYVSSNCFWPLTTTQIDFLCDNLFLICCIRSRVD